MFCSKCGANNPDGAAFCSTCGARLAGEAQPVSQPTPQQAPIPQPAPQPYNNFTPQKKSNTGLIVAIAVAVVVVIGIVAALFILKPWDSGSSGGGGSKKDTEKTDTNDDNNDNNDENNDDTDVEGGDVAAEAIEAFVSWDVDAILDLFPEELFEAAAENGDMTVREAKEYMRDAMEMALEEADLDYDPGKAKVKVTVTGEDTYSKRELSTIIDTYDEYFSMTVDDAKIIIVDITGTYDGQKETYEDVEVPMVKIGRSWYFDYSNTDGLVNQLQ